MESKSGKTLKVVPAGGSGSVTIVEGSFTLRATRETPAEISREDWERLKPRGVLEEAPPAGPAGPKKE